MSITIGGTTFDLVDYDRESDVLYLDLSEPVEVAEYDESVEGHGLRFDAGGRLVGVVMLNPRWMLEHGEPITVTIPVREPVDRAQLASVVDAA